VGRSNIITFDYELFLGEESGLAYDCIIEPTNKILELFKKEKVKGVFFVDTIYLLRLQEAASTYKLAKIDYDAICKQLLNLANHQQYIYPHLHPHWLDAHYNADTNTWSLTDTSKYRVESLKDETVELLFSQSIQLLYSITGLSNNQIDGYRAGGWSIQPFSKFRKSFLQNGIKYEMSVIPGKHIQSDTLQYDFENAPNKVKYHFEEDVCIEAENGSFTQIPISGYFINKFFLRLNHYYISIKSRIYKTKFKGSTVRTTVTSQKDIYDKQFSRRFVAQFEQLNFIKFVALVFAYTKTKFLHTVSHPKLMTKWDFFYLRLFLFYTKILGSPNTDFKQL